MKIRNICKILLFRRFACSSTSFRQNFSNECENALNKQIHLELTGSYAYLGMAFHFYEAALTGAYKFFKAASEDETKHAHQFIEYLHKRGGRVNLENIAAPKIQYESLLDAMKEALRMEMTVNESLLNLHSLASKESDPHLCDFIESSFLGEQVDCQKQLGDYIKRIELCQSEVGTYIFDVHLEKMGKMH